MGMGMKRPFLFHREFLERDRIILCQLHVEKDVCIERISSTSPHPPFHSITCLFQLVGEVLDDLFEFRQGHGLSGIISQPLIDLFMGIVVQIMLPLGIGFPLSPLPPLLLLLFNEKGFDGTGKLLDALWPP